MTNPLDAGIPVLTEIIDTPLSVASPSPAPSVQIRPQEVAPPVAIAPRWEEEQWQRAEREMRERVLQQVMQGIDLALEQRVRDNLADVLQVAVDRLAGEIRQSLQQSITELVTQVVTQEISALKNKKQ